MAGGKGGTGKTTVSSALAVSLSRYGSVLLIDGDLGAGNAHLLQDVVPSSSLVDVAAGRVGAAEARVACSAGLDLLAGGSGYSHAAQLRPEELARLAFEVGQIEDEYDFVVVDGAAGLSQQTLSLAAAAQRIWLVSTPDVTALTDAYAFLKVFLASAPEQRPELVLNRCHSVREGEEALRRLQDTAQRFLGFELPCLSFLPEDDAARRSLKRREAVTVERDGSELAQGIEGLAGQLAASAGTAGGGWGRRLLDRLVS